LVHDTVLTSATSHTRRGRGAARGLALAFLVSATVALGAGTASGVEAGCQGVLSDLRTGFAALNSTGTTAAPDSAAAQKLQQQGAELYGAALKEHPDCADDINQLVAELTATARSQAVVKGTPFLGPIGWLWNNVYYRVFSGNDVMMFLFGWSLLLSPVILVVSIIWVLRGARRGLRKPQVPEHLRFDA
jgi:hypothetical protein